MSKQSVYAAIGARAVACLAMLCMVPVAATAQQWAKDKVDKSMRHKEWVDVKAGNRTIKCFVAYPEAAKNTPAVLVIHEIFGESDWIQLTCDELAAAGYIAVAPDLVSGKAPKGGGTSELTSQGDVTKIVTSLSPDEVKEDLTAVAAYIKTIPSYNGKLATAGFCWGGGQSFRFATYNPDVKTAMVFYGNTNLTTDTVKRIPAPVYGFYGGADNRVSSTVPGTIQIMKANSKPYESKIYDGAGHGFMRAGEDPADTNPANKKARDEAWVKIKEVLKTLE